MSRAGGGGEQSFEAACAGLPGGTAEAPPRWGPHAYGRAPCACGAGSE
uniref:Uncharacterized protein n=1 Tax=Nomascus leucogenys TaxID=61853 RepID=A0A2I3HBF3_NOMLE